MCIRDRLGSVLPLTIVAHSASDGLLGGLAGLDRVGELAEVQELERDDLVLVVATALVPTGDFLTIPPEAPAGRCV